MAGVDAALVRLCCEHLDVVHLHSCPLHILEQGDVITALEDCARAGKLLILATRVICRTGLCHPFRSFRQCADFNQSLRPDQPRRAAACVAGASYGRDRQTPPCWLSGCIRNGPPILRRVNTGIDGRRWDWRSGWMACPGVKLRCASPRTLRECPVASWVPANWHTSSRTWNGLKRARCCPIWWTQFVRLSKTKGRTGED